MKARRWARIAGVTLATCSVLAGCSSEDAASRARDAAAKIQAQIVDPQATALAQTAPPDKVKQAQKELTVVREYLGDIDGKLDSVTVNAIEAFQTEHGLDSNGLLTDNTMDALRDAAKKKEKEGKG